MSIIKDLKIENDDYTIINSPNEGWLMNLSRVNIFVGANNTGKSRFMRSLFYVNKDYALKFLPNDPQFDTFLKQSEEFKKSINKRNGILDSQDQRRAKTNILKSLHDIEFIEETSAPFPDLIKIYNNIDNDFKKQPMSYEHECNEIFERFFNEIDIDDNLFRYNFYRIYIPSLRGLIPLLPSEFKSEEQTNDLYAERIKNDYFPNEQNIIIDVNDFLKKDDEDESESGVLDLEDILKKSKYFSKHSIITGLQFYESVKNYLLGDLEQREMIKEYENYLSKTFFDGKEVALIPKVKDDVLTIKIGDEKERPIYNLGDGIQSIILITLPLFLYLDISKVHNTNVLVFIEEPEIGLHPSLQRTLIETLLDPRFENFQFFFTTHSNHFIDRQFENEDISIYSFDKDITELNELSFIIENVSFNHLPTLEKLGALPSAVLMSNCVILVEGSWDIEHYQFYLDLYQKHLKESNPNASEFSDGVHYSFLRGGGSEADKTLKEWNIKDRLFYIVDADDEEEKRKKENKFNELNFTDYHILEVREVENLISKDVLINILNNTEQLIEFEVNENFDIEEYKHSPFYQFIEEKILKCDNLKSYMKKSTMKKHLVIKQKEFINNYDDLTTEAKHVVEGMYNFIQSKNS